MLSLNQIFDRGNDVIFNKHGYEFRRSSSGKIVAHGIRIFENIHTLMEDI